MKKTLILTVAALFAMAPLASFANTQAKDSVAVTKAKKGGKKKMKSGGKGHHEAPAAGGAAPAEGAPAEGAAH